MTMGCNAFRPVINVMEIEIVVMGVMKPQTFVGPTVRRLKMEGLAVTMGNALGTHRNVMETKIVPMGVMKPQTLVEPTARTSQVEGLLVTMGNASRPVIDGMETGIVMIEATKPILRVSSPFYMINKTFQHA